MDEPRLRTDGPHADGERDFEIMLRRIVYRWDHRPGLPMERLIEQAKDLLRRKGQASPLRGNQRF